MRVVSLLIVYAVFCPVFVSGQTTDRQAQAAEVRTAVGRMLASSKPKVEIVYRDLQEVSGKLIGLYPDKFALKMKGSKKALVSITIGSKPSSGPKGIFIKYEDVLQMQGKDMFLSFVPDPKRSPYADWDDVRGIAVGEILHVETREGKRHRGAFMTANHDSLSVMRGNTKNDFERKNIARVYRVRGEDSGSSKVLKGASKGTEIAEDIFPIFDPTAVANPGALAIGAGVGTLLYMLPKGTKRVLVYSQ